MLELKLALKRVSDEISAFVLNPKGPRDQHIMLLRRKDRIKSKLEELSDKGQGDCFIYEGSAAHLNNRLPMRLRD